MYQRISIYTRVISSGDLAPKADYRRIILLYAGGGGFG
jgi:hypothetical protein